MLDKERIAQLQLLRSSSIGPRTFKGLILRFGNGIKALNWLQQLVAENKASFDIPTQAKVKEEIEQLESMGGGLLFQDSPMYPSHLSALSDSPPILTYFGDIQLLSRDYLVAIVGSRHPSLHGYNFAMKLATNLSDHDVICVSGMARGIDAAAHQGSLKGRAEATIAVLGSGVDVCYPRENKELYNDIGRKGLLLSELPIGSKPLASNFPRRNRIISAVSKIVIVVEAGNRSGSMITANHAADQGREVMAVPAFPVDQRASGCLELIKNGAHICRSSDDVLELIKDIPSLEERLPEQHAEPVINISEHDAQQISDQLTELLSITPLTFDELFSHVQTSVGVLRAVLIENEILGRVHRDANDSYSLMAPNKKAIN